MLTLKPDDASAYHQGELVEIPLEKVDAVVPSGETAPFTLTIGNEGVRAKKNYLKQAKRTREDVLKWRELGTMRHPLAKCRLAPALKALHHYVCAPGVAHRETVFGVRDCAPPPLLCSLLALVLWAARALSLFQLGRGPGGRNGVF